MGDAELKVVPIFLIAKIIYKQLQKCIYVEVLSVLVDAEWNCL